VSLTRRLHRARHFLSTRVYRPGPSLTPFTWIGDTRVAVGAMPLPETLQSLVDAGVTHVVNCRAKAQTIFSGDLAIERDTFGVDHVACAPMWDHGRPQSPVRFGAGARFAAAALADPNARVLIHCQKGRRRSVLVAYGALRLRGIAGDEAARLILEHRKEARVVPAYRKSVEDWLARDGSPDSPDRT
jgi:protein-tyrosine phosphatase